MNLRVNLIGAKNFTFNHFKTKKSLEDFKANFSEERLKIFGRFHEELVGKSSNDLERIYRRFQEDFYIRSYAMNKLSR